MELNYFGSVYATKSVIGGMKQRKNGRVVFVSSQGGQVGFIGMCAYSPTKFAVKGLAQSLRMEVSPTVTGKS